MRNKVLVHGVIDNTSTSYISKKMTFDAVFVTNSQGKLLYKLLTLFSAMHFDTFNRPQQKLPVAIKNDFKSTG